MIDLRMEDQDAVSRCEFCGNQHGDDRCGCDAAKDAEITTLLAQLEEARAKAIEECAQVAENCDTLGPSYQDHELTPEGLHTRNKVRQIATAIRAIIAGSTK